MTTSPTRALRAQVPLRGDVVIRTRDAATGAVLRRLDIRNKILHGGFAALIRMLTSPDTSGVISRLRIGTGSVAPAIGDTDVSAPIAVAISGSYPYGKVDFAVQNTATTGIVGGPYDLVVKATIPGGSAGDVYNGKTISEAALITAGGATFARQIHPAIEKNAGIAIDYEWRIRALPAP